MQIDFLSMYSGIKNVFYYFENNNMEIKFLFYIFHFVYFEWLTIGFFINLKPANFHSI